MPGIWFGSQFDFAAIAKCKGKRRRDDLLAVAITRLGMVSNRLTAVDRKSTRLNSSHVSISYAVFCLKKKIPVFSLEEVLTSKLLAITEQEPDFSAVLELARALREQIDWDTVRSRTEATPFAKAFFTLVEELGIVEP